MVDRERDDEMADDPRTDEQDLTPPHGDELRSEETFGRTDRYANVDDTDAQHAIADAPESPDEKVDDAERRKRLDEIDDVQAGEARMDVRRREHSAD